MAFKDLYEAAQKIDGRISSRDLMTLAIEHSDIKHVREMWSDVVVDTSLRGFYIEGPLGPPVPVAEKGALIVLSREMVTGPNGKHWRHFVYTKELMHVFDREEEKADSEDAFDVQIQNFADPTKPNSPQYWAEAKAMWRALMVLCQEDKRLDFKNKLANDDITIDFMASALRIPVTYVSDLLRDNFEEIAALLIED
jgi:hypothetical protein